MCVASNVLSAPFRPNPHWSPRAALLFLSLHAREQGGKISLHHHQQFVPARTRRTTCTAHPLRNLTRARRNHPQHPLAVPVSILSPPILSDRLLVLASTAFCHRRKGVPSAGKEPNKRSEGACAFHLIRSATTTLTPDRTAPTRKEALNTRVSLLPTWEFVLQSIANTNRDEGQYSSS